MNPLSANLLRQSFAQWQRGELAKAEAGCRELINHDPSSADAFHLLGLIRKQAGDSIEAEQLMLRSIELAPDRAEFKSNLANLLRSLDRIEEARNQYQDAIDTDTGFRPAKLGLLRLLNAMDSLEATESATQLARDILKKNPNDPEIYAELGSSLRTLNCLPEAEQAYRQSLILKPDYAVVRHNLGALLSQLRRAEEALQELNRAAALGVQGSELEYNRARALLELGYPEQAEQALMAAVKANPIAGEPHVALANLRFMRGDPEFLRDLRSCVERLPEQENLWVALGCLLRDAEFQEEAIQVLQEAINICGPKAILQSSLATTLQETGNHEEALVAAREAAKLRPDNPAFSEILVSTLLSNGLAEEAKPLIRNLRLTAPLDQSYIAFEATAARLTQDPLYHDLYNYDALVKIYDLEPPLGWSHIEEFHNDLLPVLKDRHRLSAHPLNQSLRSGTQTASSLLSDKDARIQAFIQTLQSPLAEYQNSIGYDPNHPFRSRNQGQVQLAGCWSVQLRRSGYHVNHVHPQGWISSVYYVEVPNEVADLSTKNGWLKLGEPRFKVPGATPERFIQPKPGRLVLFPSYMWHGTTPIHGDSPRLTIAFDAITLKIRSSQ